LASKPRRDLAGFFRLNWFHSIKDQSRDAGNIARRSRNERRPDMNRFLSAAAALARACGGERIGERR
jgi:predicted nucleic acid-binding protein